MIFQSILLQNRAVRTDAPPPEPPEELGPPVISTEFAQLTGAQALLDRVTNIQSEHYFTPRIKWHNGKTYFTYIRLYSELPYGQVRLIVFDENGGLDRPITVGDVMIPHTTGVGDTHVVPAIDIVLDPADGIEKVYITQERTHLVPFEVYKSNADHSVFTKPFSIGTNLAYSNIIRKVNGQPMEWCRGGTIAGDDNHLYSIHVVESSNYFEGLDTATPRRITAAPYEDDLWHYPNVPWGHYRVGNKFYLCISRRVGFGDVFPATYWHKFYLVVTEDFVTFSNYLETFSHNTSTDGLLTDAILQANYEYHDAGDGSITAGQQVAGVSSTGKFYVIVGDATGNTNGYKFIYYQGGSKIVKDVDIDDLIVPSATTNPFNYMTVYSDSNIQMVVYISFGSYFRPHLFQTTNQGDSWTDLGDMCPEFPEVTMRCLYPNNFFEIPEDRNFAMFFLYTDPVSTGMAGMICKPAAFGELQPIPAKVVTAATDLNYNSSGLFHYKFTDGNITRSGTNVTAVTDQLGLRNATGVNNPQWNSTSNSVVFTAASSHKFTVALPTQIINCTQWSYWGVVKYISGSVSILFSITNTGNDTNYMSLITGVFNTIPTFGLQYRKGSTETQVTVFGQDNIDDGNYHVVGLVCDGRAMENMYIDGKLQYLSQTGHVDIDDWLQYGKGPAYLSTVNTVSIGARDKTTDNYSNMDMKECYWYSTAVPASVWHPIMKKVCDDNSITYKEQHLIPS